MNKYKIILYTTLSIALVALTATGAFLNSHAAKKKYATSGVAPHSKAVWSYNKKTKTLTIKMNKRMNKGKANGNDFRYRCRCARKIVYKDGINRIGEYTLGCIGDSSKDYRGFREIYIPKSIKRVTPYSMQCHSKLRDITMENGIEQIGYFAFSCTNNKEIIFPKSMKCIEQGAFEFNRGFRHIDFNEGLESIGRQAFNYCMITDAIIPDSVNFIGDGAFRYGCLNYIKLPDNLRVLSEGVLSHNGDLKKCIIPESVNEIHNYAFGSTGIINIDIPRNVEIIGEDEYSRIDDDYTGVFADCGNLKRISFKTKKLKKVYEGSMAGVGIKTIIEVPVGYGDKYRKMFTDGGLDVNVRIEEVDFNDSDIDSVRLNRNRLTVKAGMPRKMTLLYADEPDDVRWESSDESVILIDDSGKAVAIKPGDAIIKATYKKREFLCSVHVIESDADNDEDELHKLIDYQKQLGSLYVSDNIHSGQYEWRDGRLIGIDWSELDVAGAIDLNAFTYLESFKCGYSPCGIWKIDADDLKCLKLLGYNRLDVGDVNIHIENAKDVKVEEYDEYHFKCDFGDDNWRRLEESD